MARAGAQGRLSWRHRDQVHTAEPPQRSLPSLKGEESPGASDLKEPENSATRELSHTQSFIRSGFSRAGLETQPATFFFFFLIPLHSPSSCCSPGTKRIPFCLCLNLEDSPESLCFRLRCVRTKLPCTPARQAVGQQSCLLCTRHSDAVAPGHSWFLP